MTGVANPRQIERVVRGAKFGLDFIYDIYEEDNTELQTRLEEDFETIAEGMKLLTYDYIGGSGTRGYGKIRFEDLAEKVVVGNIPEEMLAKCDDILKKAVTE
jgi:CRISPR-associated protein Csm3